MKRVTFHNNTCSWESDLAQINDLHDIKFSENVYRQHGNGNGEGMFHFPESSKTTISIFSAENNRVSNLLSVKSGTLRVSEAVFRHNGFSYGLLSASNSDVTLRASLFASNVCHGTGSPVRLSDFSSAYFSSCNFLNNTALKMGGGVRALNSNNLTFSSCDFDKNHVKGKRGVGGAIAIVGSLNSTVDDPLVLTWKSCTFSNNTAPLGGAWSVSQWKGDLRCDNCSFIENKNILSPRSDPDRVGGGAVDIVDSDIKNLTMRDSYFLSNTGFFHGGGISLNDVGGSFFFDKCGFLDNAIHDSIFGVVGGSGISIIVSPGLGRVTSVSFNNSYFKDNKCGIGQGAVHAAGSLVSLAIDSCSFFGNEGHSGSSISTHYIHRLLVRSSDFQRNVAEKDGGAVECVRGEINLENNTFLHNRAGEKGGSVFLSNADNGSRVERCEFIDCSSSMGGGIHVESSAGLILNTNKFYRNTATVGGGGLSILLLYGSGNPRIENCYFAKQIASFGGKDRKSRHTAIRRNGPLQGPCLYRVSRHPSIDRSCIWWEQQSRTTRQRRAVGVSLLTTHLLLQSTESMSHSRWRPLGAMCSSAPMHSVSAA